MNNAEKAVIYEECLRESDRLQRENSKIKSDYAGNIPPEFEQIINKNNYKISVLVGRLESLFKD